MANDETGIERRFEDTGKGATGGLQRSRLRNLLVVAEVALSLILLVAASLMLRSFAQMTRVNRGFEPEHLLTAKLDFSVSGFTMVVRTAGNPANLTAAIHGEVRASNKGLPAPKVQTMNERLDAVVAEPRFRTLLLGLFGLVTIVLVSAGIYGVVSYSVAQRTHEIGIRMALGASPRTVLKLVIGQGMKLAACGIALGLAGALALTRLRNDRKVGDGGRRPRGLR